MKRNELLGSKLILEQIKSTINLTKSQKSSLIGLGLKKIGSRVEVECSPVVYGMLSKVSHLLKVTKILL